MMESHVKYESNLRNPIIIFYWKSTVTGFRGKEGGKADGVVGCGGAGVRAMEIAAFK